MTADEPERVPEPFSTIIDEVCDRDRRYFEEHPGEEFFYRPYIPGEFGPNQLQPDGTMVEVHNLSPGFRARIPFLVVSPNAD